MTESDLRSLNKAPLLDAALDLLRQVEALEGAAVAEPPVNVGELRVDPRRRTLKLGVTVAAIDKHGLVRADVASLDRESAEAWISGCTVDQLLKALGW